MLKNNSMTFQEYIEERNHTFDEKLSHIFSRPIEANDVRDFMAEERSSLIKFLLEKINEAKEGWYEAGEGQDIEFSAREMKDEVKSLLEFYL